MKSDRTTIRQRVEEVLQLRLLGAELVDIRRYASEQTPPWNVSDRQLERYIAGGDALLARTLESDRRKLVNRHLAQRRTLFARCMATSDYANARAILKDEAELLGLYPPTRAELSGPDGGPIPTAVVELTDDERAAAIAALHARLGASDRGQAVDRPGDGAGSALGAAGKTDDAGGDAAGPVADEVAPLFQ